MKSLKRGLFKKQLNVKQLSSLNGGGETYRCTNPSFTGTEKLSDCGDAISDSSCEVLSIT